MYLLPIIGMSLTLLPRALARPHHIYGRWDLWGSLNFHVYLSEHNLPCRGSIWRSPSAQTNTTHWHGLAAESMQPGTTWTFSKTSTPFVGCGYDGNDPESEKGLLNLKRYVRPTARRRQKRHLTRIRHSTGPRRFPDVEPSIQPLQRPLASCEQNPLADDLYSSNPDTCDRAPCDSFEQMDKYRLTIRQKMANELRFKKDMLSTMLVAVCGWLDCGSL